MSGDEGLYTCEYEPSDYSDGGVGLAGCILIYCELPTVRMNAHVHMHMCNTKEVTCIIHEKNISGGAKQAKRSLDSAVLS